MVNIFIAPTQTACTENEGKNKLHQIKRMHQKLQYVTSHSLSGMCAVAWLVYVGENLIKLRNSISCLFYDDHILHETRFKHIQLSVFMFINKHLWQEFNISNIVAHVLQANCNQKLITSLQW